jgi:PST family polysaccharide transporter
VVATLAFAPLVIVLAYSAQFLDAVATLRWIALGMAVRVFTWPIGYIAVAKNRQLLFALMELAWTAVNVGLSWVCIRAFGVEGAGIAFFLSYVFHAAMVIPVARRLSGWRFPPRVALLAMASMALIALVFIALRALPPTAAAALGALATLACTSVAAGMLLRLVPRERVPRALRALCKPAGTN